MYTCCGPVDGAGTRFEYNFVHSSPNINAIAWDNQLSGQYAFGNVIFYTQNGFGLNHGSYNVMDNNLIVANAGSGGITNFQADAAISIACNGFHDVYNCTLPQFRTWELELVNARINDTSSPWGKRFNWYLGDICDEIATVDGINQNVVSNLATTNAIVYIDRAFSNKGCDEHDKQNNTFSPFGQVYRNSTIDPGFANYSALNFALKENSPILEMLPNWQTIPFNEIGLQIDHYRTRIPSDAEVGRLDLAPGTPKGPPAR